MLPEICCFRPAEWFILWWSLTMMGGQQAVQSTPVTKFFHKLFINLPTHYHIFPIKTHRTITIILDSKNGGILLLFTKCGLKYLWPRNIKCFLLYLVSIKGFRLQDVQLLHHKMSRNVSFLQSLVIICELRNMRSPTQTFPLISNCISQLRNRTWKALKTYLQSYHSPCFKQEKIRLRGTGTEGGSYLLLLCLDAQFEKQSVL